MLKTARTTPLPRQQPQPQPASIPSSLQAASCHYPTTCRDSYRPRAGGERTSQPHPDSTAAIQSHCRSPPALSATAYLMRHTHVPSSPALCAVDVNRARYRSQQFKSRYRTDSLRRPAASGASVASNKSCFLVVTQRRRRLRRNSSLTTTREAQSRVCWLDVFQQQKLTLSSRFSHNLSECQMVRFQLSVVHCCT